jgi:hypothetical protein
MIPKTLTGWTSGVLRQVLLNQTYEADRIEFKLQLPHSKANDDEKLRLLKTCAAFANSFGGFVVIGVRDERALTADERIVGVPGSEDFPKYFGAYPSRCEPSVSWELLNPPIALPDGQLVQVTYIPKSWKSPHAVKGKNDGWHFPKRTNKGNEEMSIEEIRTAFVSQRETQQRLESLRLALGHNINLWQEHRTSVVLDPPHVNTTGAMLRAIEDFISSPIFPDVLPTETLYLIWQYTRRIESLTHKLLIAANPKERQSQLVKQVLDQASDAITRATAIYSVVRGLLAELLGEGPSGKARLPLATAGFLSL